MKATDSACDLRATPALIVFTQAGNVLMATANYGGDKRRLTQCSAVQMIHIAAQVGVHIRTRRVQGILLWSCNFL